MEDNLLLDLCVINKGLGWEGKMVDVGSFDRSGRVDLMHAP